MDNFEKQIHSMFDHIWDCNIDHPVFEDTVGDLMEAVIQCYQNLTSTQPERKKGHWIDTGSGQECSVCHEIQYGYDNYRHFCSNCGAYMRGEEDD